MSIEKYNNILEYQKDLIKHLMGIPQQKEINNNLNLNTMETIKVYSPVNDKNIKKNVENSPIWKNSYTEDELDEAKKKHDDLYCYKIKFDKLKPVQVTKISKV